MSAPAAGRDGADRAVLIVGAGPVGLVVAAELLTAGVPVRVIDRNRSSSVHSRATSLWPRVLELLDRISVTEELVDLGHRVDRVSWFSRGRHLGAVQFSALRTTPYRFGLALPQSITEDVLERRVLELGGSIERGRELLDLDEHAAGVTVTIAGENGAEVADVAYLVAADGAHSTVRDLLGLDLEQHPLTLDFAIGDVTMEGSAPEHVVAYCWSDAGPMAYASLGHDVYRLAVRVPQGTHRIEGATGVGDDYDSSWFEQVLRERGPRGRYRVTDLRFAATFVATIRAASSYATDRCFLVGDAAHVMSPAGGQGMNTGVQDAVNLGWKLAGVINGTFAPQLLGTYGDERPPAVRAVAEGTARQAALGGLRDRKARLRRDLSIRARSLTGRLSAEIAPSLGQLDTVYGPRREPDSRTAIPAARPGSRLPVALGRPIPGWPQIPSDRCCVLLWNVDRLPTDVETRFRAALSQTIPAELPRIEGDADRYPPLRLVLGHEPVVALVRPDGHVVSLTSPEQVLGAGLLELPDWAIAS